jgi:hypothetical protein
MRSGTSLVEQILASHSRVYGAGELPYLDRIVTSISATVPDITRLSRELLNQHAGQYLDRLRELDDSAAHVIDKMPQNFMHLGYIALLFPGARIIHCSRNPLDTCLSCYFQNFGAVHGYSFDLEATGHCYAGYRKLMDHWQHVLDIPVHEVRYETLVADTENEINRLLRFCGLDPEPACLCFYENRRSVRTASYDQVHKPIYNRSVARWRHYEKYLGKLADILG